MEVADTTEPGNGEPERRPGPVVRPSEPEEPPDANCSMAKEASDADSQSDDSEGDENEDEDEDEDEEPRLKYGSLTKSVGSIYRNGDATSACLLSGDKMIVGTHNGNLHVFTVPSFKRLRAYRMHSATVTSISISPFPLPPPQLLDALAEEEPVVPPQPKSTGHPQLPDLPRTPSNMIFIATSSIDGNVCVQSLVDPKDKIIRNFGRPIQSVALSPLYKSDRTYLSGGLAGNLVRTVGGRIGMASNSNIMGGSLAQASGWLGTLGLSGNSGTDTILHSGEGPISTIKWSLSGKFIVWVNEEGIKIMRSNLDLEHAESDFAWQTMGHIDRPNLPGWEEMASVWKARAEWVDENTMEKDDGPDAANLKNGQKGSEPEKLIVGWGGTVWIIDVFPGGLGTGREVGERKIGRIEFTKLRLDCIISGVTLYTPRRLLVLAYIIPPNDSGKSQPKQAGPRRGIRHRQNGLQPELRLIDIHTKEELAADTLTVSRYESLTASDYHLGVLSPLSLPPSTATQRRTLESLGTSLLDATLYPVRLFSSATSIRSTASSGDRSSGANVEGPSVFRDRQAKELAVSATKGVKIFVHSPYDCAVAVKRGLDDKLTWLVSREKFAEAWELIDRYPEVVGSTMDGGADSTPSTPTPRQGSLSDFFRADSVSSLQARVRVQSSSVEREKRRISERWLEQLVGNNKWKEAGRICGKVLDSTAAWEHWIWVFARNDKFDEITPYVPTDIRPPLPSVLYEVILGHYVSRNRSRFQELLKQWPSNMFDVGGVIAAIQDQLDSSTVAGGTEDWKLLTDCLARLFMAGGRYREALRRYIRLQDADTVMQLIREHHLLDAVVDDIPGFVLIRVPREKLKTSTTAELEDATSEPIDLLVRDAASGIVGPAAVVSNLQAADLSLFLYFYFRKLWTSESAASEAEKHMSRIRSHHQTGAAAKLVTDERRALMDPFADTAVELFAAYDRSFLMEFLKSNTAYSYSAACSICEQRHFTHELIYLFSKTGQTKRALQLILSDLDDISHAISFAKSQDDPDLWEDLLSYSMDKPEYIRSLLAESGTSIDPIKLVRRIPSGLEIEGLREGLTRMIREHDIQASISKGVATVLIGEVTRRMQKLRVGQRRGIKFDINTDAGVEVGQAGRCAGCQRPFVEQEKETLVGFGCGHIYHVSHLHDDGEDPASGEERTSIDSAREPDEDTAPYFSRTVGLKVTNARLLRDKVGFGCRVCGLKPADEEE